MKSQINGLDLKAEADAGRWLEVNHLPRKGCCTGRSPPVTLKKCKSLGGAGWQVREEVASPLTENQHLWCLQWGCLIENLLPSPPATTAGAGLKDTGSGAAAL